MLEAKYICDECGQNPAVYIVAGGNPIPTSLNLSNIHGNQGYCLCEKCLKLDPADWKNIWFSPQYLEAFRQQIQRARQEHGVVL